MKQLEKLQSGFTTTQKAAEKFANATNKIGAQAEKAGKGAEKGAKGFGQFASSLARIVKYRVLRTILKELAGAFKEGLTNAYQFSKGIGGELAAAMDSLSTKSLTMKNQLGAAFGELLTTVMPILLQLIEIVRAAANAISMLFAALGGRGTYLKAVDASKEWAKATAGGAAAAKEWKNQLMGFDEINRLDEPPGSGGGGGGGSGVDPSSMFEESPVLEWVERLGERLRKIMPILGVIAATIAGISLARHIGEALGWGEAFGKVMTKLIGLAFAIGGAVLLWDGFADALNNGVDWGNLLEMLGGTLALVIGLATMFGVTGAAIALLIGGVALCIVGFKQWIETGKATDEVLTAISFGILGLGIALSLLVSPWFLLVAAIGIGVTWIIGRWDKIKEWWNENMGFFTAKYWVDLWNAIKDGCSSGAQSLHDLLVEKWDGVKKWWSENVSKYFTASYWDGVLAKLDKVKVDIKSKLVSGWSKAKTWWQEKASNYFTASYWQGKLDKVKSGIDMDGFKDKVSDAWGGLKDWWGENASEYFTLEHWQEVINTAFGVDIDLEAIFSEAWEKLKAWWQTEGNQYFTASYWQGKIDEAAAGIEAGFQAIWDAIARGVIGFVNTCIGYLNQVIASINSIISFFGGTGIGYINRIFIGGGGKSGGGFGHVGNPTPYATGGFPEDGLFFANHGELVGRFNNGQTAVANNAQIIEGIRQGVMDGMMAANNGRSTDVRVYLDGKQITNAVTRNQNSMSRATGVAY